MKRKVLSGGYAYGELNRRLVREGFKMVADRAREERETVIRRIERAVDADWLDDRDIAAEVGCCEWYVGQVRRRLRLKQRTRMTG